MRHGGSLLQRGVGLWGALACLLSACGEPKTLCPEGFQAQGTTCVCPAGAHPEATAGDPRCVADGPGVVADAGSDAAPPEDAVADTGASLPDVQADSIADVADGGPDAIKPDVKTDIGKPDVPVSGKNAVGAKCADDLDCLSGLSCFSTWPKGYCTITSCDAPGNNCPGSAACWTGDPAAHVCTQSCETESECRTADGYACKRLTLDFGGVDAALCLPSGKAAAGGACVKTLDCKGSATCLTDMPGGYCARLGCNSTTDTCDAGTACVMRNGKPICLKTCAGDAECQIATKQPRKCVAKTDLGKNPVQVCLDSSKSAPVGSNCVADLDCDSKVCSLFAKGTCAGDAKACMSDGQCGVSGPCNLDPGAEKGVCTAPCSTEKACPTGGVCVPGGADAFTGSCEPSCKGPGDDTSCGGVPGLLCVFGKPLPPPASTASPVYACAAQIKGSAGADCAGGEDCTSSKCFMNGQSTAGYCTAPCGPAAPCAFGTVCVSTGKSECWRMCAVEQDCPPQMACKNSSQAGGMVCLPL